MASAVLSYQPRAVKLASSKASCRSTVAGAAGVAVVDAVATFDSPPNTAFRLGVPLKATSWTSYCFAGVSPRIVQDFVLSMAEPSGATHVPRATVRAEPQAIGLRA